MLLYRKVNFCCSFKTSKNDHVIEVKLYDDIDFMCPYYPPPSAATSASSSAAVHSDRRRRHEHLEFYVVYMVSVRCINPLKGSAVRWLHFEVLSAIQV